MIPPGLTRSLSFALTGLSLAAAGRAADDVLRLRSETGEGMVRLIANLDDDDRDGRPDAADEIINGAADHADTTPLVIEVDDPLVVAVRLTSDTDAIRLFSRGGDQPSGPGGDGEAGCWQPLAGRPLPLLNGRGEVRLECDRWSSPEPGWSGRARIEAAGLGAGGEERCRGAIAATVAPVRLVAETAPARQVFVAMGRYDNAAFVARLRAVLGSMDVPLVVHQAGSWQEMWMQDTMELAYSAVPGRPEAAMTVVLAGLRGPGNDPFPETLLGPDLAVARLAEPRPRAGGDAWADWYGNLTASPPTNRWPQGRVIIGRNSKTGEGFHPDVVRFLAAQRVQPPVWIDTSWLLIKHVDEIVAFLPGRDGKGVMLVPDPLSGLQQARAAGLAAATGPRADVFAAANRRIAAAIDELLAGGGKRSRAGEVNRGEPDDSEAGAAGACGGLLALLGWDADRVVRLPVAFTPPAGPLPADGLSDAEACWSNPVNMLYVNGTVICGEAGMPEAVRDRCREQFRVAGATRVVFVDDGCYQRAKGNVHCATNARRDPPADEATSPSAAAAP